MKLFVLIQDFNCLYLRNIIIIITNYQNILKVFFIFLIIINV